MNIVDRYLKSTMFDGMDINQLEEVLNNTQRYVKLVTGGQIILTNGALRCVENYYDLAPVRKELPLTVRCHSHVISIGLTPDYVYKCVQCHRHCLELHKQGKLARKIFSGTNARK